MAAEAFADRSGSGLTNATKVQAVVLDTDLHVWPDGGPYGRESGEREMVLRSIYRIKLRLTTYLQEGNKKGRGGGKGGGGWEGEEEGEGRGRVKEEKRVESLT
jgi:hypothetical protein